MITSFFHYIPGSQKPVTAKHREEYVPLHKRWMLKLSMELRLKAFNRGVFKVFLGICIWTLHSTACWSLHLDSIIWHPEWKLHLPAIVCLFRCMAFQVSGGSVLSLLPGEDVGRRFCGLPHSNLKIKRVARYEGGKSRCNLSISMSFHKSTVRSHIGWLQISDLDFIL